MINGRKIIALCISRIHDVSSYKFTVSLNEKIIGQGYSLFVYNTCSDLEKQSANHTGQASVFEYMDFNVIDAVIVFEEEIRNKTISDGIISRAKTFSKPVIVVGGKHEGCISVDFDGEKGFELMVRHIVEEHNARSFHFFAGNRDNIYSSQRVEAFQKVLDEKELPFNSDMVSYCDFCSAPAQEAAEQLVSSGNLPDAIICANDVMAIGVCGVLNKYGIKIPDDVIVTGYDGINEIYFSKPRITSVNCSYSTLAYKIGEVLSTVIDGTFSLEQFLVTPELVLLDSCGCRNHNADIGTEYLNELNDRFYRYQSEDMELSEMSAKIQRCENYAQAATLIDDRIIYDMCCVLKPECTDETVDPTLSVQQNEADRNMFLFYDNDGTSPFVPRNFSADEIVPGLGYHMDNNRIFIFTALNYSDIPMGYICHHFSSHVYANFLKIPQTVNMLNNAIGGYRSLRHKQHLVHKIDEMYRRDSLTGLLNRRGFSIEYRRMLDSAGDKNTELTVILTDLDGLKHINDTFGHEEGDVAIRTAAQALMAACPSDAVCTRFGGDEMLAVCLGSYNASDIKSAVRKYCDEFNSTSGKPYSVSASVGIYFTDANMNLSFEELVRNSDKLMYMEKEKKRAKEQYNSVK